MATKVVNINNMRVYETVKDAANDYGITESHLSSMLTGRKNNTSPFIYKSTFDSVGIDGAKKLCNNSRKSFTGVINVETLEEFDCQGIVADNIGMKRPTFNLMMKGTHRNSTPFVLLSYFKENGICHCKKIINQKRTKSVIDTETGREFDSVKSAAKFYGINVSTLYKWLNGNGVNKTSINYAT